MPYEMDKDALIEDLGEIPDTDMTAEIRSYDGNEKKLCVYRMVGKKNPKKIQIFRLAYPDVMALGDFLVDFTAKHGTGEDETAPKDAEEELDISNKDVQLTVGQASWVTVNNLSIHLKAGDDGVSVSIYPLGQEGGASLSETWAVYGETNVKGGK